MRNLHLGFDSSTQSLSALVIDLDAGAVVYSVSLNFGRDFPQHGTEDGVLRGDDPTVVEAPPLLWLDALDAAFERLRRDGVPLGEIRSICGSGQQHGSVYLTSDAPRALAHLDPTRSLAGNLGGVLSRERSPIWMDSSTTAPCDEITRAMGSAEAVTRATGSAATERFTGPQIRKFWQQQPAAYARTAHIALVSSFLCSVLSGRIAPIDRGDGAGMNLMDIATFRWHAGAAAATAPGVLNRLPAIAAPGTVVGPVSRYFVERYGVNGAALSVVWSGDNPCSVVGLGLVKPGMVAISMGTSYTYMGTMDGCRVDPNGEGHVFGSPAGGYLALNCFKNGGLARARVRDAYGLDWDGFRRCLAETPPGNHGRLMLPWFDTEIVPRVLVPGVHRLSLPENDAAGNCRALVEAQMMAMRLHAGWMDLRPATIYATGGASEDPAVLQVMADVFGCPAQPFAVTKSAALGAALMAAQAWRAQQHGPSGWDDLTRPFAPRDESRKVRPAAAAHAVYTGLLDVYADFERSALARG